MVATDFELANSVDKNEPSMYAYYPYAENRYADPRTEVVIQRDSIDFIDGGSLYPSK